ncbi:hypothetical protein AYO22_04407 [Fonsecaea multimorphosa]|nr:hypothetical protein AYO22_04407 [Fonsecaea multimorphosa]
MAAAVEPNAPVNGAPPPATPKPSRENEPPLPPVPAGQGAGEELDSASRERVQHVLSSDIGMGTLLQRLKQSIGSTKDFAAFLKERSVLEEKHAQGLKRLSKSTHESIGRPDSRQGTFAQNFKEMTNIHERMAEHALQYVATLYGMSEELYELATNSERARKHWKQTGLNAEKRVQDAESAMEKAKLRYNSLAEQYDRARTGERQPGKFGLKRSAAQLEEELRHKVEAADADYSAKVEAAQSQRNELLSTLRPQTVHALSELIRETDAGLTLHVQKFADLSEKLLVGFGLCIAPIKGPSPIPGQGTQSLRQLASDVNNEKDLADFVLGFSNKAPTRPNEIKYEKHPSLSPKQQQPGFTDPYYNQDPYAPTHGRQVSGVTPYPGEEYYDDGSQSQYPQGNQGPGQMPQQQAQPPQQQMGAPQGTQGPVQRPPGPAQPTQSNPGAGPQIAAAAAGQAPGAMPGHVRNVSQGQPSPAKWARKVKVHRLSKAWDEDSHHREWDEDHPRKAQVVGKHHRAPWAEDNRLKAHLAQVNHHKVAWEEARRRQMALAGVSHHKAPWDAGNLLLMEWDEEHHQEELAAVNHHKEAWVEDSHRKMVLLRELAVERPDQDQTDLRMAHLAQALLCTKAVELFGLEVEGIYRTSGSTNFIMELRQQFDHDANAVDLRNSAAFHDDIAAVTTLLKHFLRDLPDPLLTAAQYRDFIQAAKIEDDIIRRDSVHALVNALPDPNYATLRVLAIHLHKVAQHSARNKMTNSNLAIVFAPTLMGQQGGVNGNVAGGADIADAGWQAKVVETILNNTFQIFDDD